MLFGNGIILVLHAGVSPLPLDAPILGTSPRTGKPGHDG